MSNNLIVDVDAINSYIAQSEALAHEATMHKYYIINQWCAPLQLDSSVGSMRLEANAIGWNAAWTGWNTPTIKFTYGFRNSFQSTPIVTATYDGPTPGVTIRTTSISGGTTGAVGKDSVTFYLTQPSGSKWSRDKDHFALHFIAIGK
jgi:hypothetical protein